MTDHTPFLTLVENFQRSARKESQDVQLDLFCTENETLAALIVLNIVNALLADWRQSGHAKNPNGYQRCA